MSCIAMECLVWAYLPWLPDAPFVSIGINDDVFGYVQPLESNLIRLAANFAHLLKMDSQLMMVATPGAN